MLFFRGRKSGAREQSPGALRDQLEIPARNTIFFVEEPFILTQPPAKDCLAVTFPFRRGRGFTVGPIHAPPSLSGLKSVVAGEKGVVVAGFLYLDTQVANGLMRVLALLPYDLAR